MIERPAKGVDLVLEVPPHAAIDGREGFVEQQHGGLARERSGQSNPLAFAAREFAQAGDRDAAPCARAPAAPRPARRRSRRGRCPSAATRSRGGEVRKQRVVLEDEADAAPMRRH